MWDFENVHGVQTLSSDPLRARTPLPPFLNPTPRLLLQPNIWVSFLNQDPPKFNLLFIILFHDNQSRSSNPISQDKQSRNFPLPPPFIKLDITTQNMVLRSGRTFNREPLPPIPPIRPTVFPLDPNPLLNHPDQSSSYDILQHMDRTPVQISILELIKKSKSHQEVLS